MSPENFRTALKRCGFVRSSVPNDQGLSECARVFGKIDRTVRLWAVNGPPAEVAVILRMMQRYELTPAEVARMIEKEGKHGDD